MFEQLKKMHSNIILSVILLSINAKQAKNIYQTINSVIHVLQKKAKDCREGWVAFVLLEKHNRLMDRFLFIKN